MGGKSDDVDPENLRVFYQSAQQRRIHLSQVTVTMIGYAVTLNVAIWGFLGKGYVDLLGAVSSRQEKIGPWYLFIAAVLSSIVVILWRLYTQYLDHQIARGVYPKLVFCEHQLSIPEELNMWDEFLEKRKKQIGQLRTELEGMCAQQKHAFFSKLSGMRRSGDRGHKPFNSAALVYVLCVWTVSLYFCSCSQAVLYLSMIGLLVSSLVMAHIMWFYAQQKPCLKDLQGLIDGLTKEVKRTLGETQG
jgi:hypothetical protein